MARFEDEVDPDRTLPEAERARRAEHALKSYMAQLALRSAKARRRRKKAATEPSGNPPEAPTEPEAA